MAIVTPGPYANFTHSILFSQIGALDHKEAKQIWKSQIRSYLNFWLIFMWLQSSESAKTPIAYCENYGRRIWTLWWPASANSSAPDTFPSLQKVWFTPGLRFRPARWFPQPGVICGFKPGCIWERARSVPRIIFCPDHWLYVRQLWWENGRFVRMHVLR